MTMSHSSPRSWCVESDPDGDPKAPPDRISERGDLSALDARVPLDELFGD